MQKKQLKPAILFATVGLLAFSISTQATWITQWQAGAEGRGHPVDGTGGGPDVDFVQEGGGATPAPGDPNSPAINGQADDDYYFAGVYPAPIGNVANDEIAFERAFTAADPNLRIHFNLPIDPQITASTQLRFNVEPLNLHTATGGVPLNDVQYAFAVTLNGVEILPMQTVLAGDLNTTITSPVFTLGDVNANFGPGVENVVELTGTKTGDSAWLGFDYHALELNVIPEPQSFGLIVCGALVICLNRRRPTKK